MSNNVDHPNHYQSETGLEVIDVIKAFTSELSGEEAFCIGNAIKYICRYSKKNGAEDLEKAKWYIDRAISIRKMEFLKTPDPTSGSDETAAILNQMATFAGVYTNDVKNTDNERFLFASREEASKVLKELQSMIHEHGYVTLADLHDMCELAIPSPDYKYVGWKNAGAFHIRPTDDGWELSFYVLPESIEHD